MSSVLRIIRAARERAAAAVNAEATITLRLHVSHFEVVSGDALLASTGLGYAPKHYYGSVTPSTYIFYSPTGHDTTGNGSILSPYKTLFRAVQLHNAPGVAFVARGGNHVISASGRHYIPLNDPNGALAGRVVDGTPTAPIWFTWHEPDGLHSAKIIATIPSPYGWLSLSSRKNYIIDGMHYDPPTWGASYRCITATGGSRSSAITVRRMKITKVGEDGIKFSQCQGGMYVYDNEIWDVGEEEVDYVAVVPNAVDAGKYGAGGIIAYNEFYHKGYHLGEGPVNTPTVKGGSTDIVVIGNIERDVIMTAGYGMGLGAGGGTGPSFFIPGFGTAAGMEYEARRCHHKGNLVYDIVKHAVANHGVKDSDFDENIIEKGSELAIRNTRGTTTIVTQRPLSLNNRYRNNRFVQAPGPHIENLDGSTSTESGSTDHASVDAAKVGWPWVPGPRWKYAGTHATKAF
jgi:hypothetical protein